MHFTQLVKSLVLLCLLCLSLAEPMKSCDPNNAKAPVEREMSPAEHSLGSEKRSTDETLVPAEADAAALTSCQNCGKIKKKKAKFNGGCDPAKSKGYRSSHNCKNAGGKSYLCVRDGVAHCYKGNLANLAMEHGECFL